MMSQMPLAEAGGGISLLLTDFGERHFVGVDSVRGSWAEGHRDPDATVVTPGQQGGSRRRTDGRRNVEVREFHPLLGHPIEVRRGIPGGTERPNVGVAHIVNEYNDDVRRTISGFGSNPGGADAEEKVRRGDHGRLSDHNGSLSKGRLFPSDPTGPIIIDLSGSATRARAGTGGWHCWLAQQ